MNGGGDNSVPAAAATSAVPQVTVNATSIPAGKRGPVGTAPRTNYSKVNTGSPPVPNAGADAQKSVSPLSAGTLPKLATRFPEEDLMATQRPKLQDMVKDAVARSISHIDVTREASRQAANLGEKVASEEKCAVCKAEPCKCPKEKKASYEYALKLASAIEFIAGEFSKEAEGSTQNKPGEGPGALTVSQATASGSISDNPGQAHHQPPMHPAMGDQGTQLENNASKPAGGKERMVQKNAADTVALLRKVAKESDPEVEKKETEGMAEAQKGLSKAEKAHEEENKEAFAVTDRGHEHDAKAYELLARQAAERAALLQADNALEANGAPASLGGVLRFNLGSPLTDAHGRPDAAARHYEYAAKEHARGSNAWNPLGGMLTPSSHEEGGTGGILGHYGKSAPKKKEASALVDHFLSVTKQASDSEDEAHISAGKAVPPEASAAGEAGGAPAGGMPQGPRGMVHSNEAATNATRGAAYANRKADLKKYLSEPALTSSTDKVLNNAFSHTGQAGPKVASASSKTAEAKALLAKLTAGMDTTKEHEGQ